MHRDDQPIDKGQKFKMFAPLSDNPRLHRKMLEKQKMDVLEGIKAGYETVERGRQETRPDRSASGTPQVTPAFARSAVAGS